MKRLMLLVCIGFIGSTTMAQTPEFTFRVEIISGNDGSNVAPFFLLMFDDIPQKTNEQGMVYLPF